MAADSLFGLSTLQHASVLLPILLREKEPVEGLERLRIRGLDVEHGPVGLNGVRGVAELAFVQGCDAVQHPALLFCVGGEVVFQQKLIRPMNGNWGVGAQQGSFGEWKGVHLAR